MNYKDTIFLPKTSFPMRGNLPEKEPGILQRWENLDIYKKRCEKADQSKKFVLHDGPPFANGMPHAGTSLNRVLKDIILRMKWMNGYFSPFVPGWDCHGLPIEWKVEEILKKEGRNKNDISISEFRDMCKTFANHWINIQRTGFKRLGTLGDWNNPYLTMNPEAEATIIRLLGKFLANGAIYRGEKPVYWSIVEQTALADAEIEYMDKVSTSIHVAFPVLSANIDILANAHIVIWTTTPWTIPANRAISFSGDAKYSVLENEYGRKFVVASKLLTDFVKAANIGDYKVVAEIVGNELTETICRHPLYRLGFDFEVKMLDGDHVTLDTGTGFVHTAPGHGLDDYNVCKKNGIPVPRTVNEEGLYYSDVPVFGGMHIFKTEGLIVEKLDNEGNLIAMSKITHSYPHSWRSKSPLIFRTTPQWFISLDNTGLRDKALAEIEKVKWIPQQGYARIKSFVENRGDWCISRQRVWGTPLPIFVNKATGDALVDEEVIERIAEIIGKEGGNAWYTHSAQEFLGDKYNADDFIKSQDTVDVWFESSSSNVFVLQNRQELNKVADLYLEGSDQHRGWFQHSLLVACQASDAAPFKAVLTHGFVMDEKGRKMSKSLGNTVDLPNLIEKIGADIFRLWVSGSDFTADLKLGDNIIKQHQETYKKMRNTLRYMLGALSNAEIEAVEYAKLPILEKYILHSLYSLNQELMADIEKYDINAYFSKINVFCNNELSSYFFDIRKDRLYCDSIDSLDRKAYLYVLKIVFDYVVRWIAPVLVFTAEEAWTCLYGEDSSIHLQEYLTPSEEWNNAEVFAEMTKLKAVRKRINEALEVARQDKVIGSSLEACVTLTDPDCEISDNDVSLMEDLCIISRLKVLRDGASGVSVAKFDGQRCERCWKFFDSDGGEICGRCKDVLSSLGNQDL